MTTALYNRLGQVPKVAPQDQGEPTFFGHEVAPLLKWGGRVVLVAVIIASLVIPGSPLFIGMAALAAIKSAVLAPITMHVGATIVASLVGGSSIAAIVNTLFRQRSAPSKPLPQAEPQAAASDDDQIRQARHARDYRVVPHEAVPAKLAKELARAAVHATTQVDNPRFEQAIERDPPVDERDLPRLDFSKEHQILQHNQTEIPVEIASMKGEVRRHMEDKHIAKTIIITVDNVDYPVSIFGIFDGHGGSWTAEFLKDRTAEYLKKQLELGGSLSDGAIFNALKLAFVDLDDQLLSEFPLKMSGSTACVAMILNDNLWVANIGDSRAVLNNNGQTVQLSEDMKPDVDRFQKRIVKRGGTVTERFGDKVLCIDGLLAVGGAIGDRDVGNSNLDEKVMKCVPTRPKITKIPLSEIAPNARLIIGCDGLWDVCSSNQVCAQPYTAKQLTTGAYAAGSTDNISTMVIEIPGTARPLAPAKPPRQRASASAP